MCYAIFLTEGSDFSPVSEELLFTAEGEQCISVVVDNDGILEEMEFFFLELNTTDPRAFMFSPRATINILDNDSKFYVFLISNTSTLCTIRASLMCNILQPFHCNQSNLCIA